MAVAHAAAMHDYYDHHPLVRIERHVVLAGLVTADTRALGYQLAALNGLPFADLERKIEHHAGASTWKLARLEGVASYRRREQIALERALDDRPFGIVVLGDGTLIEPANRRLVDLRTHLVIIDYDDAGCYWRLSRGDAGPDEAWHPFHPEPLGSIDQVRPFAEARREGLRGGDLRLPTEGRRLADLLVDLRGWLDGLGTN